MQRPLLCFENEKQCFLCPDSPAIRLYACKALATRPVNAAIGFIHLACAVMVFAFLFPQIPRYGTPQRQKLRPVSQKLTIYYLKLCIIGKYVYPA
ncbi:MAG: hypothetical protein JWP44_3229 [Mucilaginibacter sp.]|nr:hypothetical protein [Mucilaginibacter sp.]